MVLKALRFAFDELILNRRRQIPFWVLIGFLPTFIAARLTVHHDPHLFLDVRGTHIHHFIYGVLILSVMGFISLVTEEARRLQALFYGIGLALAFDEFGIWLHLNANYDIESSEIAMAWIFALLIFMVYGIGILRRFLPHFKRLRGIRRSQ